MDKGKGTEVKGKRGQALFCGCVDFNTTRKVTPCLPLERMQVESTLCWLPFVDPEAVSAFDTLRLKSFVLPVHTWAVSQNHRLLEKRDMLNKTVCITFFF